VQLTRRDFCAALPLALAGISGLAPAAPEERVIRIEARRFAYTPSVIALRRGEAVLLEVTAIDFPHGFSVPDLKLRADLTPGRPVRLRLRPERAGRFTFLCDNFCGAGHEEMNGTLVVQA
jgi:cytochrome c oxidase subunit 2